MNSTGLSEGVRVLLLEDLSKQTDLLQELEVQLAAIRSGRISYEKVINEYRSFVAWCQEFRNCETLVKGSFLLKPLSKLLRIPITQEFREYPPSEHFYTPQILTSYFT